MILRIALIGALALAFAAAGSRSHADAAEASIYCPASTVSWVYAVSDLSSDLDVGISYANYAQRLRTILRLYHRTSQEPFPCLHNVAVPAESATNHFITAYRVWTTCNARGGCDANREAQRQRQWAAGSAAINRATNNLG